VVLGVGSSHHSSPQAGTHVVAMAVRVLSAVVEMSPKHLDAVTRYEDDVLAIAMVLPTTWGGEASAMCVMA
jgi:hypothetical protein